jgi:deoxyribodipyrimidine photo-lyase
MSLPNRQSAIERLNQFLPRVPAYATQRNFDRPLKSDVSCLSPYIRRRLITEQEVLSATLKLYPFERAEKFIQEVVWRTYWKGWLEAHPEVWFRCVEAEHAYIERLERSEWGAIYRRACQGATDLAFFNDWVRELVETGYLHNHTRMWFASVWVFTLRIPWQLGAMFMYRHLLDGDPASNTLSWHWVAGLQTRGKSYLATPENITKYSEGRWRPKAGELVSEPCAIEPDDGECSVELTEISIGELPDDQFHLITTSEDLSFEGEPRLISGAKEIALLRHPYRLNESDLVRRFIGGAEADALSRWGASSKGYHSTDELLLSLRASAATKVAIVAPAVGPYSVPLRAISRELIAAGVGVVWYRRAWDKQLFELADRGFFPFWERVKKRISRGEALFSGKSAPV